MASDVSARVEIPHDDDDDDDIDAPLSGVDSPL